MSFGQLKTFIRRILSADIIKVFSLNAVATLVRMLSGMVSVKVIAVIIGPSGIALLGQLSNFSTILLALANGGISNGITKYVAEYKDREDKIKSFISNAFRITLLCTLIVSVFLIVGCIPLSRLVLMSDDYYYVFIVFGLTILLYALNILFLSVLNGYKQFRKYVIINICGTIINLIYTIVLVYFFGLSGALINAVTFQSIVFFVTLWMCRKASWMRIAYFLEPFHYPIVKKYLGFSLMSLTTMILAPMSQMILRGYVISGISATDAGIWEGMNRISAMYLSVITTAFSIYYLPRLSEISDPRELHLEIFRCYKAILPILLVISVIVYFGRHFVLWMLFTPEFYPMEELFGWQLIGDFFKISGWLLAYIMVAKAKTVLFISTELLFTFMYVLFALLFVNVNGIVGLVQGYLCNYIIYLLMMAIIFRNILAVKKV